MATQKQATRKPSDKTIAAQQKAALARQEQEAAGGVKSAQDATDLAVKPDTGNQEAKKSWKSWGHDMAVSYVEGYQKMVGSWRDSVLYMARKCQTTQERAEVVTGIREYRDTLDKNDPAYGSLSKRMSELNKVIKNLDRDMTKSVEIIEANKGYHAMLHALDNVTNAGAPKREEADSARDNQATQEEAKKATKQGDALANLQAAMDGKGHIDANEGTLNAAKAAVDNLNKQLEDVTKQDAPDEDKVSELQRQVELAQETTAEIEKAIQAKQQQANLKPEAKSAIEQAMEQAEKTEANIPQRHHEEKTQGSAVDVNKVLDDVRKLDFHGIQRVMIHSLNALTQSPDHELSDVASDMLELWKHYSEEKSKAKTRRAHA